MEQLVDAFQIEIDVGGCQTLFGLGYSFEIKS